MSLRKVVMVTGCSSGIGEALAQILYLDQSLKVVITSTVRSIETLRVRFSESERFLVRELDVTNSLKISQVVSEIFSVWGNIDILVNNAGVCYRSVTEHMDDDHEEIQMATNYLGPMNLIRAVLPSMREHCRGHIINVSSLSGSVSMPTMGSYGASKAALQSSSEALWYEVKPFNIYVSIVQPGFINSDSFKNVVVSPRAKLSLELNSDYSQYYVGFAQLVGRFMKLSRSSPKDIAKRIYKLMNQENPPLWNIVTLDAHVLRFLRRCLPIHWFNQLIFNFLPKSSAWSRKSPQVIGSID